MVSREPVIAVIDDDESFRVALVEALSSLGYGARAFASAEEFFAGDKNRTVRLRHHRYSHARHERL